MWVIFDLNKRYTNCMDKKHLYRSQKDKMIAGVCGGLAEYFNIDPVIIRIIAVILLLPGGLPGFLPYVILWIVVPLNPNQNPVDKA
jgi:phage shock protein C